MSKRAAKPQQSSILGLRAFAAISAVEGLKLSPEGRKRVTADMPFEQRLAEILNAYKRPKLRK